MGKVSLESSNKLSALSRSVGDVKNDMQDNLNLLNNAFATACESWQDKNAQTCQNALSKHTAAMRSALMRLGEIEGVIDRLSRLAAEYEDI